MLSYPVRQRQNLGVIKYVRMSVVIETPTIPKELQVPPKTAMYSALHFRDKILFIRRALNISESELGRKLGVDRRQVWDWEHMRSTIPKDMYIICAITEWEAQLRKQVESQKEVSLST